MPGPEHEFISRLIPRLSRVYFTSGLAALVCLSLACASGKCQNPTTFDTGDDISYQISDHQVRDLIFLDFEHGWIVVTDHTLNRDYLFRTSDGGATWERKTAPNGVQKLFFLNATSGWALQSVGAAGSLASVSYRLLRTEDGGSTWTEVSSHLLTSGSNDQAPFLTGLAFSDSEHGWIVGGAPYNVGIVLETVDGGRTIRKLEQPSAFFHACVGVIARNHEVWLYGVGGFLRSDDSGKTWSDMPLVEFDDNKDLDAFPSAVLANDGNGWLIGSSLQSVVLSTKNFGKDWQVRRRAEILSGFEVVSSWDEGHACAGAAPNWLFCTADGGVTWNKHLTWPDKPEDNGNFFERLVMLPSGHGLAVRGGGYLYETTNHGKSWSHADPISHSSTN